MSKSKWAAWQQLTSTPQPTLEVPTTEPQPEELKVESTTLEVPTIEIPTQTFKPNTKVTTKKSNANPA